MTENAPRTAASVPAIFRDPALQETFDRNGFAVIPFLGQGDIDGLLALFQGLHTELPENAFTSSSYSRDPAYKSAVTGGIERAFQPGFERVFRDYRSLGGAFLYKTPGPKSELFPHQDWSIVDESCAVAINVWFPLTPVDETNGTLHVLPGSHRFFRDLRSPTLPTMYAGHERFLIENTVPLIIQPGQAVALNQALFHYSPSNRSAHPRIAITAAVKTASATLRWNYRAPGSREVEVWEQDDDFLNRFDDFFNEMSRRPTRGRLLKIEAYEPRTLDRLQVESMVTEMLATTGTSNTHDAPILADSAADVELADQGYSVSDFLGSAETAELIELFAQEHPGAVKGFMASVHSPDRALRRRVSDRISEIVRPSLARRFRDYRALGGSFIVKAAGHPDPLRPHQDWTIVDESRFRSFNVWIPLCDVGEENGAIRVLPRSHVWSDDVRGPNIQSPWLEFNDSLWNASTLLPMKAGQALVYDHRLVHASGPNRLNVPRLAVVFGLTHRFAELRYYAVQDGTLACYRSSVRFMVEGDAPRGPGNLERLSVSPWSPRTPGRQDVEGWLGVREPSAAPMGDDARAV